MIAIMKREFKAYFASPLGFVFLAVFYFFSGLFFFLSCLLPNVAEFGSLFSNLFIICLLLIPMLTMRLLSEEKKQRTDQLLLTSPTSLTRLVAGKFLGAYLVYLLAISVTVVYFLIVMFSTSEGLPWASYLGNLVAILLLGAGLIALGTFISSLTESTVISVIITYASFLFILLFEALASVIKFDWFYNFVIQPLSVNARYTQFTTGIFELSHVLFFLSMTVIFLFLTVRVLESKRWN